MELFETQISFFVVTYVVALAVSLAILSAEYKLPSKLLPIWMQYNTLAYRLVLLATYSLFWFGIVGLGSSPFFSPDLAFIIALIASFGNVISKYRQI